MEWSFDATDPEVTSEVRLELLSYLERHAANGSSLRVAALAFDELVGNACRFAPGPVWVHVDWSDPQPVLRVRDLGPGFSLAAALSAEHRGGLRLLSDVAGPVHLSSHRSRGADVSLRLPVTRAVEPVPVPLGTAAGWLPAPEQVADDGSVGRDAFLSALGVQLAQVVEQAHGPAAAQAAVTAVGTAVGTRIEQEFRRARALTDRLSPRQVAELCVSLKAAIGGDFYVIAADDDQIVLGNRRCPFGDAVRKAPSLCQMTSNVFRGIAERNTGHGAVRLEQRIAVGDPECRVVVSLRERSDDRATVLPPAHPGARLRAVLAEDALFLREPLVRVLSEADIDVVAQCDDPRDLLASVSTYQPDVAIIDFCEADTAEALTVARAVRHDHPYTGVIVLAERVAVSSARELLEVASSGVGYLMKDRLTDVDDFLHHVRAVADGGTAIDGEVIAQVAALHRAQDPVTELSPRERDVLELCAQGMTNDEIAARLVVTKRAVEKHVGNIFQKLDLPPTADGERRVLAVLAYQHSNGD
jgi:DNA-binding NarL/FixJ family response regulator